MRPAGFDDALWGVEPDVSEPAIIEITTLVEFYGIVSRQWEAIFRVQAYSVAQLLD
jgi:hypothetical protein